MNKPKATEGCRVAQEIAVIRAALTKRGYRVHKRPKQAAWKVFTPFNPRLTTKKTGEYYLLTYQPSGAVPSKRKKISFSRVRHSVWV